MPRILLINPNVSTEMTIGLAALIRPHLPADHELLAVTADFGATVIASRAAYAVASHASLDCLARHGDGVDGILLGCFGDPGIEALREASVLPVVGLFEASVKRATSIGRPFGIVTAGKLWRDILDERIAMMGATELYRGTEALDGTGLAVARHPETAFGHIRAAAERLHARGAETIILGGASMGGFASRLSASLSALDCVLTTVDQLVVELAGNSRLPAVRSTPSTDTLHLSIALERFLKQS